MFLSQTSEYALRAMAWLATAPPDAQVRAKDLSVGTGIPPHYLSKILRRLVLAELLVSQKGHGGGFTLARPPDQVRFLDILAAVDAYPTEERCAFGWGECNEANPCPLHKTWSELQAAIYEWADSTTLASIYPDRIQDAWGGRPPPGPAVTSD